MPSILLINGKWRALVRRKGFKPQCDTFMSESAARRWARGIEVAMDNGTLETSASALTVNDVVAAYRKLREGSRPILDTTNEHYMLKTIERGLGEKLAAKLIPEDLVAFAIMRREEGAGQYTVNMDISKLGTVYRYGAAKLKVMLPDVVGAARPTLTYLRLIGGSDKRERRPTEDEYTRVLEYFLEKHGPRFTAAVEFAVITAMRRGEVTAVKWDDLDTATKMLMVWRKHPRKGKVLEPVPMLGRSLEILLEQPRDGEYVFPFHEQTLTKYFTNCCKALSIPDLRFHDLRHEGVSAMFEQGYVIQQVALVSGHKDWRHLKRYTNLKPADLHKVKLSP